VNALKVPNIQGSIEQWFDKQKEVSTAPEEHVQWNQLQVFQQFNYYLI
jgi:hypothetical protein